MSEQILAKPTVKETIGRFFESAFGVSSEHALYDRSILLIAITLACLGLVMVASASIPYAMREFDNPLHFVIRHIIYLVLSFIAMGAVMKLPISWWEKFNPYLLFVALGLLIAVLIMGKTVNGATRWLSFGPLNIQAAEPAKLFFFAYLAGYLVRREADLKQNLKGFLKPLAVFFILAILLLIQPDLGTVVVMFATTVGLLFLAGSKLIQFFALFMTGIMAIVALIILEPYRLKRVTSFLDPWQDPFGSGYQLTQSLMAYGRGDWFGTGLGNSIQKLDYLPEAHTDFVVAILAEEFGFIGVSCVIALTFFLVAKVISLGSRAIKKENVFAGYLAYAIGIWISFQAAVNIGASAGILPTKGLTLPLVSYGGSSLIVMSVAIGLVLRIDYEQRCSQLQATRGSKRGKPND
ncbi:cell division protein FtsW [Catenovulum sp. 2E275]|uniref:cell division protein FtsW n=1 Tax=Catenovulum sp. 2E275 TaxID=2980497 RepID=UPI0021D3A65D|nr:cell division protein FtsW [Catenovulum sp. 2E275]MCU4674214.1 cell division protein FtsW [Catenovulum sp. 2E275]